MEGQDELIARGEFRDSSDESEASFQDLGYSADLHAFSQDDRQD